MARRRSARPRQAKVIEPEESPEEVHRGAILITAVMLCRSCLNHSLELIRKGQFRESPTATAKARDLLQLVYDIERGVDTRLIEEAAIRIMGHMWCIDPSPESGPAASSRRH